MKKEILDKRKEAVVIKSALLFLKNGYVNTGLNEILEECNISKGSFYYYFKNKDDLLIRVIHYHTNRIIKLFDDIVDDLVIYKLKDFFYAFFHNIAIIKEDDKLFFAGSPLGNINSELSNLSDQINFEIDNAYKKIENRIFLFLQTLSCINEKYHSNDTDYYTYLLINNLEGTCLKLKRLKKCDPIDEFLKFFNILIDKMITDK